MATPRSEAHSEISITHRFLDEAGDTSFYGKRRIPIVGKPGVSLSFAIGMVKFHADFNELRKAIRALQDEVLADEYVRGIASVAKKAAARSVRRANRGIKATNRDYFLSAVNEIIKARFGPIHQRWGRGTTRRSLPSIELIAGAIAPPTQPRGLLRSRWPIFIDHLAEHQDFAGAEYIRRGPVE